MNRSTLKLTFAAALVAAPTSALAQFIEVLPCTPDALRIPAARARLEWARRCGLSLNTGSVPNTGDPNNFFTSTFAADLQTFVGAKEYRENTPSRAFSGNGFDYEVNASYSWAIFGAFFGYNVFQETSGPTVNFWKWSMTQQRSQPLYPTFASDPNGTGTQLYPHPTLANCNLYTDPNGIHQWPSANNFYLYAYCTADCYTPDQRLRFGSGDVNILDAFEAGRDDVVTLAPDATLDDPRTQVSRVQSYTAAIRDAEQPIYKLTTASGGSLSVTGGHPVLIRKGRDGRLIQAERLREGDHLVGADGMPDPITRVEKTTSFGKVYNIIPRATERVSNLLIAQGFLVGSARFESDDLRYMNRALRFRAVPDEVMPR
jgi:hypothetical protein